ncbi:MAG TPA: hypothetical protein VGF74_11615 [Thermoleophilaceae bacterium]
MLIALVRPDAWNFPLLLHVLGAMLLVGSVVLAGLALIVSWRDGNAAMVRLGYRALLLGAVPSWILMRVGAEWIASKEGLENSNASWIGIGFSTADSSALFIIIATVLAGFAMRRAGRGEGSTGFRRVSAVLVALLVVAYAVTIWAMTTKPS